MSGTTGRNMGTNGGRFRGNLGDHPGSGDYQTWDLPSTQGNPGQI